MKKIVSAAWLYENLKEENLIILDASLGATIDGTQTDLNEKTIPNSRYFDLKANFSDGDAAFPNTLPTAAHFEVECQKLGVNTDSKIVVFDNLGVYSSPRVWWMFKAMGHKKVYVLDGGLPEWNAQGFEVEERKGANWETGNFKATLQQELVVSYDEVVANIKNPSFLIVDARSEGRFNGTEPEPRKQLQSGSIPHSVNIPYTEVLENGKFKSKGELQEVFDDTVEQDTDLVFSCGSGLTACIIMLASEIAGQKSKRVYDGSWTEWAELQNLKTGL
ncbi:sulfurtransferase [Leeuwenhoekiella sp. MAR_2009_132]|uniref:sulfurtransferase n=1 Tax=Leeuwenhoekiella sp. MAR_2009_132 TaxID=1392489 RepID=UPI000491FA10|nr:sulfurtransferase [Leeuwenhoekiella sp. MAR_2009_132]